MRILTVKCNNNFNAGPKAPRDIIKILQKQYNAKNIELINSKNILNKIFYRINIFFNILLSRLKKEILVIQFPIYESSNLLNKWFRFCLKNANKNKTIIFIHDLEGLRNNDNTVLKQEIERLNMVKYVVAHNNIMKKFLEEKGVKSKIFVLQLFDYIINDDKNNFIPTKEKEIIYAGNLLKEKSPFLYEINEEKINFKINIYGIGYKEKSINNKIQYCGKYTPDVLPNYLKGKLGLIWDGEIAENDEENGMKRYTKYNNPHKLSCYISAGIPVIAWSKSAIANFVIENDIGYVINNIYDINNIDLTDYEKKLKNIEKIKNRVKNGYYSKTVFEKIMKDMKG